MAASSGLTIEVHLPNLVGSMTKTKVLFIWVVPATAALTVLGALCAPPGRQLAQIVNHELFTDLVGIWTLLATPVAFMIPRVRAMWAWRVPAETYFFPPWQLRLWLACLCGSALGFFLLAILQDLRIVWLAGSFLAVSAAFWFGASRRLRHPSSEYTIPWTRWILRRSGWRLTHEAERAQADGTTHDT